MQVVADFFRRTNQKFIARCRNDMKYNVNAGECQVCHENYFGFPIPMLISQVLMDVDCGRLSYDSPISPTVRAAADMAKNLAKGLTAKGESMFEQALNSYDISSLDFASQMYLAMEVGRGGNDQSRIKALQSIFGKGKTDDKEEEHDTYKHCPTLGTISRTDLNRTLSPHESLCTSMLRHVDRLTISKTDLEEAFCRDIDSFNAAFIVSFIFSIPV